MTTATFSHAWPSGLDANRFFASSAHEEALARLEYLVAAQRRLGLLMGARGSGKSLVLARVARQAKAATQAVAMASAATLEANTLLAEIASQWGNPLPVDASQARLWQAVTDALVMHRCEQRPSLLLVDDAGHAPYEVLDCLARLVRAGDILQPQLSIVVAVEPARASHLGGELLERADLRIELAPLDAAETRDYLHAQWSAEEHAPRLALAAEQRLHELAAGLPRRLNHLANLVMLAARAEGREEVDAATVDAVYRELSAQSLVRR